MSVGVGDVDGADGLDALTGGTGGAMALVVDFAVYRSESSGAVGRCQAAGGAESLAGGVAAPSDDGVGGVTLIGAVDAGPGLDDQDDAGGIGGEAAPRFAGDRRLVENPFFQEGTHPCVHGIRNAGVGIRRT